MNYKLYQSFTPYEKELITHALRQVSGYEDMTRAKLPFVGINSIYNTIFTLREPTREQLLVRIRRYWRATGDRG